VAAARRDSVPPMSSTPSLGVRVLLAVLGLGPGGRMFYRTVFVLAVPALLLWFVVLPRLRAMKAGPEDLDS